MEGGIVGLILGLEGAALVAVLIIIIILIFRRIEKKKTENFEKRDN
ncbi:MAG: hypothetical protein WD052_13335 [Bacteroidales bacterium]